MASTFVSLYVHFVFSTKNRQPLIVPELEPGLHAYVKGIVTGLDSCPLAVDGTEDHLHVLASMSKKLSVVEMMEEIKRSSSVWAKDQGKEYADFYWQQGYGAFSIGRSGIEALKAYIGRQKEHHRRVSFQDEFRRLLAKYEIEFDERYVWG